MIASHTGISTGIWDTNGPNKPCTRQKKSIAVSIWLWRCCKPITYRKEFELRVIKLRNDSHDCFFSLCIQERAPKNRTVGQAPCITMPVVMECSSMPVPKIHSPPRKFPPHEGRIAAIVPWSQMEPMLMPLVRWNRYALLVHTTGRSFVSVRPVRNLLRQKKQKFKFESARPVALIGCAAAHIQ